MRYQGDFDWPGVAIAGRMYAAGAVPWRMTAKEYRTAVAELPDDSRLGLAGTPVPTPWDVRLSSAMQASQVAVHEESLLPTLLRDL